MDLLTAERAIIDLQTETITLREDFVIPITRERATRKETIVTFTNQKQKTTTLDSPYKEFQDQKNNMDLDTIQKHIPVKYRDIFKIGQEYALAHFISKQTETDRGVGISFRKKYGEQTRLLVKQPL